MTTTIHNEHDAIDAMLQELHRARHVYPEWPVDLIHAASILAEEAGEVVKACNDLVMHGRGRREQIASEAVQVMAMALRFLVDTPALHNDAPVIDAELTKVRRENVLLGQDITALRLLISQQDGDIQRHRAEVNRLHTERQIWMLAQVPS